MGSLEHILDIREKITDLIDKADKYLDIAKSYPPEISDNSIMYYQLAAWIQGMGAVNNSHEEPFVELEFAIRPKEE